MAITGNQHINVGLPNEATGSDSLYSAFNKVNDNFDQLFACASPYSEFLPGTGIQINANSNTGQVEVINSGVLSIIAGNNVSINQANGNVTISAVGGGGGGGLTSVGITSSTLSVSNSPLVVPGNLVVNLPATGVTAGSYARPNLTVDAQGRITSISNGGTVGTVTSVGLAPGTGIQVSGSPITTAGTMTITNTGVTKINAGTGIDVSGTGTGVVTISASGSPPTGVTNVAVTSTTLVVTGSPITSTGTISVNLPTNLSYSGNIQTSKYFIGDGGFLSNISTSTVTANAQPNITSLGTLTSVTTSGNANVGGNVNVTNNGIFQGNVTAPYFIGNVVGNISGNLVVAGLDTDVLFNKVGNAGASDSLQFNYTSNVLSVKGNVNSYNANLGNIATANYVSGTLTTAAQPNITSLGTLSSINILGNANVANLNSTSNVVASGYFIGNGSKLTTITAGNVVGTVASAANATFAESANTVVLGAQPNITSVGTLSSLAVLGNVSAGNINVTNLVTTNNITINSGAISSVDYIDWDTAAGVSNLIAGRLAWDDADGTLNLRLKGNAVTLQIGQEEVIRVYNAEANTLLDGEIVYLYGTSGDYIAVKRAQANATATSTNVLGMVTEPIASANLGFITRSGTVNGLDTSGKSGGQTLYLSTSVPGGYQTTVPAAPNNIVELGYVQKVDVSNGSFFVNISETFPLEYLTNVTVANPTSGESLVYDSGNAIWVNKIAPLENGTSNVAMPVLNGNVNITANGNTTLVVTSIGANVYGYVNTTDGVTASGNINSSANINASGNLVGYVVVPAGNDTQVPMKLTSGTNLTSPIAGGIEYDGKAFYGTPSDAQRGVIPTEQVFILNTDRTTTPGNAVPQSAFGVGVNLSASTRYWFRIKLFVSRSATNGRALTLGWGGTATLTRVSTSILSGVNATLGAVTSAYVRDNIKTSAFSSPAPVTTTGAAADYFNVNITGLVDVDSPGGTFIPLIGWDGADFNPGTVTIYSTSMMSIYPINSSSGNTVIGNWS